MTILNFDTPLCLVFPGFPHEIRVFCSMKGRATRGKYVGESQERERERGAEDKHNVENALHHVGKGRRFFLSNSLLMISFSP